MLERNNGRPDHLHISRGGMGENFWNYVEIVAGKRSFKRFLWQRMVSTILSAMPFMAGSVIRGRAYGLIMGSMGSKCLIEKDVEFNVPQNIFLGSRVLIGKGGLIHAGNMIQLKDDVHVSRYCTLRSGPGDIVVNEMVNIGTYSHIDGHGGVEIGKNTLLARNVEILSGSHIFKDPAVPIRFQGTELKKTIIGEDVWLGSQVIVLPGVTIGDGTVVGAGAVVTKNIPDHSIASGVPAKVIRKRE